ncbi:SDR family oxidoreductase [Candidatus Poribacteria bacterium]|nr:SDR family oxidoreductase [Candidatus Poribacteria bacterium]
MKVQQMFELHDRVAIITGGATHLGRAMTIALGELGAATVIASRRKALCEQVAAELQDMGIRCVGLGCDVTDESQVNTLVDEVVEMHGRLDIMVCNAGGATTASYIPNASIDEFTQTWEMNVKSTYMCAQAAARVMIPQRSGTIITLGSIHGFLSADKRLYEGLDFNRSGPPYQAAKGGIVNLTRALAVELGEHNITVNCISPGQIPKSTTDPELAERCRVSNPLERTGVADDIKGAVALLASRAGNWITGHNLVVDGGWSLW